MTGAFAVGTKMKSNEGAGKVLRKSFLAFASCRGLAALGSSTGDNIISDS